MNGVIWSAMKKMMLGGPAGAVRRWAWAGAGRAEAAPKAGRRAKSLRVISHPFNHTRRLRVAGRTVRFSAPKDRVSSKPPRRAEKDAVWQDGRRSGRSKPCAG